MPYFNSLSSENLDLGYKSDKGDMFLTSGLCLGGIAPSPHVERFGHVCEKTGKQLNDNRLSTYNVLCNILRPITVGRQNVSPLKIRNSVP